MKRIKSIEQVFGYGSLDEAPPSVVHVNGNEGQPCQPSAGQETTPNDGLQQSVVAQNVEHQYESIAAAAVVTTKKDRQNQQPDERGGKPAAVFAEMLDGTESEKADKEREEDILPGIVPGAAVCQVPGYFRNKGKQQQVAAILLPAVGMDKPFDYEEGEDGEGKATDGTKQEIDGNLLVADDKQGMDELWVVSQIVCSQMINEHRDNGNKFQPAAIQYLLHNR